MAVIRAAADAASARGAEMNDTTSPTVATSHDAKHTESKRVTTMRQTLALLLSIPMIIGTAFANHEPSTDPARWYDGTWEAPDENAIPNTPEGNMIRYGKLLLTETYKYLGAQSSKYSGNRLSCTNCHLQEGRAAFGASWAVVYYKYGGGVLGKGPYSTRSNRVLDMNNRIHDCMQRSMNGFQLPDDSYELQSMIAYMRWLSTGLKIADWSKVIGQGNINVPELSRPADPVRGKLVYEDQCAPCHQRDGSGIWDDQAQRFVYPAVWGPTSFNDGAGMYRLTTAVGFVKGNMPYGWANASDPSHQLSAEDSYDAMAYVITQARPVWSGYLNDWGAYNPANCMPNWLTKRVDAGYEWYYPRIKPDGTLTGDTTYPSKYTANQHKYGPWAAIQAEQNFLQDQYRKNPSVWPNCQPFEYKP